MAITRGTTARSAKDDVTAGAPKTEAEAAAEAEPEGSGRQSRRDKVEKPPKKRRRKLSKGRAGELQFITITEPEEIRNQQNQSALRRHVMKKVLRDRDSRRSTPGSDVGEAFNSNLMLGPAYSSAFTQNHHATSGNLAHWLVTEWQPSPRPLMPGSASPLYGASYYVKPEHHELMAYYNQAMTYSMYPLQSLLSYNPVTYSFQDGVEDEALFLSFIYAASVRRSFIKGLDSPVKPDEVLALVVRQLSERITGNKALAVADSTIRAVACLAQVESMIANRAAMEMHVKGLFKMISLRGGAENLDKQTLCWCRRADIEGAAEALSKPILSPMVRELPPLYTSIPGYTSAIHGSLMLQEALDLAMVSQELRGTLVEFHYFLSTIDHAYKSHGRITLDPWIYTENSLLIQQDLLCSPLNTPIEKALQIASILMIRGVTRELWLAPESSNLLIRNLCEAIEGIEHRTDLLKYHSYASLLLWLHLVGAGCCGYGTGRRRAELDREHDVFADGIRSLLERPGLSTWALVKDAINRIMPTDAITAGPFKRLYSTMTSGSRRTSSPAVRTVSPLSDEADLYPRRTLDDKWGGRIPF